MRYGYETTGAEDYDILKENARSNRKYPTEAERSLWQYLRGDALGVRFRRQHPIAGYIADFVCLPARLVVEVDGEYHFTQEQQELDSTRTKLINDAGFKVIRFTNEEVVGNIDYVIQVIKQNIHVNK